MINLINENTWIISDTHFNHDAIVDYEPIRNAFLQDEGFANQDEAMITLWNANVSDDHLVLHLGDFSFKNIDVIKELKGRIVLLVGNHDIKTLNKFKEYELEFPDKFLLVQGVPGTDLESTDQKGISGLVLDVCDKKIMFSHYPLISEDPYLRGKAKDSRDAMAEVFENESCDLNIHGHLHTKDAFTDKSREINVSVERMGFQPVRLKDILK